MTAPIRRLVRAAVLAATLPVLPAAAAPEGWQPLLDPAGLAAILERAPEVRVLRVTGDHAAGHIPGALPTAYGDWRGPQENPGQLPDAAHLADLVRSLGIAADTPVVVVHQGANPTDMGAATRVYWTLKSLGVQDIAVLNGGFTAWATAGLPVETGGERVAPSDWQPEWSDAWRVTTAEVEQLVAEGSARLIDARPRGFFEGALWSIARPGTIRGARHLTHEDWFGGNALKPEAELRAMAAERVPAEGAPLTVSFCNTGHWASINWFVLSEVAGVPNTRMYAESMAEWTMQDRPLDNAPTRLQIYWQQTRDWVTGLL